MKRLTAYRSIEGLTQEDVAEVLGVPKQRISEAERGTRAPAFDLATLGYSADRMAALPDMSTPLHRHYTRTRSGSKKRAQELVRLAGEVFSELRTGTRIQVRLERQVASTELDLDDVEDLAQDIRTSVLDVEASGPILNLTGAVERAGVAIIPIREVVSEGAGQTIDGLSSWVAAAETQPVIGLDPEVSGERFRFSLAHELGHLVMHNRAHGLVEDEANRFAGALLLPRDDMLAAFADEGSSLPTLSDFLNLKSMFGVSVAALVYRARDLKIIDDARFRSLQIQKSSSWGRRNEPNDSAPNIPKLLVRMIENAGGIETVSNDLGVPIEHLRLLTGWTGRPQLRLVR